MPVEARASTIISMTSISTHEECALSYSNPYATYLAKSSVGPASRQTMDHMATSPHVYYIFKSLVQHRHMYQRHSPARRKVMRQVSFGKYSFRRDPPKTYSTMASDLQKIRWVRQFETAEQDNKCLNVRRSWKVNKGRLTIIYSP